MTERKRLIKYLTISDIHFYSDSNETAHIVKSADIFFDHYTDKSRFTDLDVLFIAGDIFDYYRDSKHVDVFTVLLWMQRVMSFCVKYRIKLRILEGTPSHDHKQSRNFAPLAEGYGDSLDYAYYETLAIEKMDDLGISVLYVPDEWAGSAAACQAQVQELLERNGLEKVTIACMHGMFDFQIPDLGEHPLKHDTQWYLDRVEAFINIGHDHGLATYDRVLVQGSFDRMAHGEEGKKGGIVCYLDALQGNRFEFIENKHARIFKTITLRSKDLDTVVAQVTNVLEKLPENAHVRLSSSTDNPIFTVFEDLRKKYPRMRFKKHKDKKQSEDSRDQLKQTIALNSGYVSLSITKENIVDLVFREIGESLTPDETTLLQAEMLAVL